MLYVWQNKQSCNLYNQGEAKRHPRKRHRTSSMLLRIMHIANGCCYAYAQHVAELQSYAPSSWRAPIVRIIKERAGACIIYLQSASDSTLLSVNNTSKRKER